MQKHKFGVTCPGTRFVDSVLVPSQLGVAVLCQDHGHPQLCLPQAQDTWTYWGYNRVGQVTMGIGLQEGQHRACCRSSHCGRIKGDKLPSSHSVTQPSHAPDVWRFQGN
jgi:hypothetical protein